MFQLKRIALSVSLIGLMASQASAQDVSVPSASDLIVRPVQAPAAAPAAQPAVPPEVSQVVQQANPAPEPSPEEQKAQEKSMDEAAFDQALSNTLMLTPEQIKIFKEQLTERKRAQTAPVYGIPAEGKTRETSVTLKPGEQLPTIQIAYGNATPLTFSDITGAPWPIVTKVVGNPNAYDAQLGGKEGETNILILSAKDDIVPKSNLVVMLKDYPVPITLDIEGKIGTFDARLDVKISTRGPNAVMDVTQVSTLPPTDDNLMTDFLQGLPPQDAKALKTNHPGVEAWRFKGMLYVRTPLELMSPNYVAASRNVSGTFVYSLVESPVLLLSDGGRMAKISISDRQK